MGESEQARVSEGECEEDFKVAKAARTPIYLQPGGGSAEMGNIQPILLDDWLEDQRILCVRIVGWPHARFLNAKTNEAIDQHGVREAESNEAR